MLRSRLLPAVLTGFAGLAAGCRSSGDLFDIIEARQPNEVAVAYRSLGVDGATLLLNGDLEFDAASALRLPIMIELFRRADVGELDLDGLIRVERSFVSVADGSMFTLDAGDDEDAELYRWIGTSIEIRDCMERMLRQDSRLATHLLLRLAQPSRVQTTVGLFGATKMRVSCGSGDLRGHVTEMQSTVTAHDLMMLLAALVERRVASLPACFEMTELIEASDRDDPIFAGLPADTRVVHVTGSRDRVRHEAALVFPRYESPYILVILTDGVEDADERALMIAEISRLVYRDRPRMR